MVRERARRAGHLCKIAVCAMHCASNGQMLKFFATTGQLLTLQISECNARRSVLDARQRIKHLIVAAFSTYDL